MATFSLTGKDSLALSKRQIYKVQGGYILNLEVGDTVNQFPHFGAIYAVIDVLNCIIEITMHAL